MQPNDQVAAMELPRYQCHKQVGALEIAEVLPGQKPHAWASRSAELVFVDSRFLPITVSHEWCTKHVPVAGGYLVVYEDGYHSFSPKAAFEAGYSPLNPDVPAVISDVVPTPTGQLEAADTVQTGANAGEGATPLEQEEPQALGDIGDGVQNDGAA
jgi:hypothetical protein